MKAVIDRFEGEIAVLLVDEDIINLPKKFIPLNSKEGEWLTINIELDTKLTKEHKQKVKKLLDKLVNKEV